MLVSVATGLVVSHLTYLIKWHGQITEQGFLKVKNYIYNSSTWLFHYWSGSYADKAM